MNIWAAIDLRGGEAVQLVGGDPSEEPVRLPDPAAVAERWLDAGFRHLHVVDLDAALGDGRNDEAVAAIAAVVRERREAGRGVALLQVGGGLRDDDAVARALELGAHRCMVGTRAVEDRPWLQAAAERWPERIVVAADVRDREVVTHGWTEGTAHHAHGFVASLDPLPLAGVLVTDVGREGQQEGADDGLFRDLAGATRHPVMAAGGVTTRGDLAALAAAGVAGAVLGMALYTGRLDPADALEMEDRWGA
jgi:phosphoribosylformimino-5-aminoimidazole carboxamide ribotide isomerase